MADGSGLKGAFAEQSKPEEKSLAKRLLDVMDGPFAEIRNVAREFVSRPEMAPVPADMPKAEYREKTLDRIKMLIEEGFTRMPYDPKHGGGGQGSAYINIGEILAHADMSLAVKQGVQFGLFGTSIERLGTEKHQYLIEEVITGRLLGGFGMTEMACGSDVQGTQTTAVYDHATRSFEINTPHADARKTYIGNAAKHGRMMVVFAQLQMAPGEESKGVHAFLVPVRDEKTGEVMPGITIGDNGHKVGLNGVDNGTLCFDKVKVPYDAMLDKFGQIDANGEYKSDIAKKSARFFKMIGTLVTGRVFVSMAALAGNKTALASAIDAVENRKVFGDTLMDKQHTQSRLIPKIAEAYALHFATRDLLDMFEKNDPRTENMANAIKAVSSDRAMETVDEARQVEGGKGFMSERRYGVLRDDMDVFRTFEGDNFILRLQVAKAAMTSVGKKFKDASVLGKMVKAYDMSRRDRWARWAANGSDREEFLNAKDQLTLFEGRERSMAHNLVRKAKKLAERFDQIEVGNLIQDDMAAYADAYAERVIHQKFVKAVESQKDPEVRDVLKDLCDLYAVHTLRKNALWYLENDHLSPAATHALVRLEHDLNAKLRPKARTLVDAFGIPPQLLHGTAPEPDVKPAAKSARPDPVF
jgi:acyl-CoA oxidase